MNKSVLTDFRFLDQSHSAGCVDLVHIKYNLVNKIPRWSLYYMCSMFLIGIKRHKVSVF